ncbi:MAG TPA: hypothetical protein VKR24_08000, partial [Candidatus Limnocylindrales bacterium]|nr:hypothetical protein [Candidatus Limnocylindrales bacterium]
GDVTHCCLIAYDADGNVVGTLDTMVHRNAAGEVDGLYDFEAHELAGGKHRDIWFIDGAAGSGTWPEWLGGSAHYFRVELSGKRITALVHRTSGHRRERHQIEYAIEATPVVGGQRDIRHLVGRPSRHLVLDENGRTVRKPGGAGPSHIPLIGH